MATAKKTLLSFFLAAAVAFAITAFLLNPARYAACVRQGVSLWAVSVLPATFPFLVLCTLFSRLPLFSRLSRLLSPVMDLFGVSGNGGGLALLSALSGYPVGAKLLSELCAHTPLSSRERFRLACLCTCSGPAFLVGVVGAAMLENTRAGWILLLSHLVGIYSVCIILRFCGKNDTPIATGTPTRTPPEPLLRGAVLSVLCVGGLIALFTAFGQMLADAGVLSLLSTPFGENAPVAEGFLQGLMEMTTGCARLAESPSPQTLALCAFLVTFGGSCVLAQQLTFLTPCGVRTGEFLLVKCLQAAVAALCCFLLAPLAL